MIKILNFDVIIFVVSKIIDVENCERKSISNIRINVEIQLVQKHEYLTSTFVV